MTFSRHPLKRVFLILCIALFIWTYPGEIQAREKRLGIPCATGGNEGESENISMPQEWEGVEKYWSELQEEMDEFLPAWQIGEIWGGEGSGTIPYKEFCRGLGRYLLAEVVDNLGLLGQLLFLAVAAALLKSLQGAFSQEEVARLTEAVAFFVLLGLALKSFTLVVETGRSTVGSMVDFMLALLPVLFTLLASLGHITLVTLFHPFIIFAVHFIASLVSNVIFPLIFCATILYLANHLSSHFKINRLADFFRDCSIFGLGLLLTLFIGLMTIQGVAGGIGDAIALRTAKFLTGAIIPVVGGILTDTVETVVSYSLLIKNGATIAGLIILALMVIFPLLKILALVAVYKFCGAIIQPLGETTLGETLQTMSESLTLIFAAVATVALVFFIGIAMLIGASNATVMLR